MSGQLMTTSSGTRMRRGVTALLVLCGVLLGVPAALLSVNGDPVPRHIASLSRIVHDLTSADTSGHLFVGLAIGIAWIAWAAFAMSVVLELIGHLRHRPMMRIPGLGAPRRAAAGLFTAIAIMMGSGGMAASAFAAAPPAPPPAAVVVIGQPVMLDTGAPVDESPSTLVYHVRHGDNLGDIAHRFLGRFDLYPRLVAANPTLITSGPDHIQPGWTLHLPSDARDRGARAHASGSLSSTLVTGGSVAPAAVIESVTMPLPTVTAPISPAITEPTQELTATITGRVGSTAPAPHTKPLVTFGAVTPLTGTQIVATAAGADEGASPRSSAPRSRSRPGRSVPTCSCGSAAAGRPRAAAPRHTRAVTRTRHRTRPIPA